MRNSASVSTSAAAPARGVRLVSLCIANLVIVSLLLATPSFAQSSLNLIEELSSCTEHASAADPLGCSSSALGYGADAMKIDVCEDDSSQSCWADGGCSYWTVTPDRGYLPARKSVHNSTTMPFLLAYIEALQLHPTTNTMSSASTSASEFLNAVEALQPITADVTKLQLPAAEDQLEFLFKVLSMLTCRYIREASSRPQSGGRPLPRAVVLPPQLAILNRVALSLRRAPSVGYASLVLDNCEFDPDRRNSSRAEQWRVQTTISGLSVEEGFYRTHCEVEQQLAPAIDSARTIMDLLSVQTAANNVEKRVEELLFSLADSLRTSVTSLKRMWRSVDPAGFFNRLRPHLKCNPHNLPIVFSDSTMNDHALHLHHGKTFPGSAVDRSRTVLTYNAEELPGPTGAQTSSLPFLDAVLGVDMDDARLREVMGSFTPYWPRPHQQMIQAAQRWAEDAAVCDTLDAALRNKVKHPSSLSCWIMRHSNRPLLVASFDDALTALAEFRAAHIMHTEFFITSQLPPAAQQEVRGTGGTMFTSYLCAHFFSTLDRRIELADVSKRLPIAVPTSCIVPSMQKLMYF